MNIRYPIYEGVYRILTLKRGNKQNNQRSQTHSLLFFTGRKTARIHLQPCHPIRFQTSKDGHGEYPEKSSPEPLSVL